MSSVVNSDVSETRPGFSWRSLVLNEDWWAVWIGLALVAVAWLFFAQGQSIGWLAVAPPKWKSAPE